jgi:exonuclease SbcC
VKLLRLHLQAFGPFTDRWLDLGDGSVGLHLVCGPNEAGKSSTLRALTALRHGIEMRSPDDFVHPHPAMRVGAVLLDRDGREVQVVRRKGRGQTLSVRGAEGVFVPASADLEHQLTGGLTRADHETLYGLDHERLRQGGRALLAGEGDLGAALFEASAGVRSLQTVVTQLEQEARRHFVPGARGTRGRINEALRQHADQLAILRDVTLRPTAWTDLQRVCEEAGQALQTLLDTHVRLDRQARQWRERLAVAPLLVRLDQSLQRCAELADAPRLGENAPASRSALQASTAEQQQALAAVSDSVDRHQRELAVLPSSSPAVLLAATAIERLVAQGETLEQCQRDLADTAAEQVRLEQRLAQQLAAIDAHLSPEALLSLAPTVVARAQAEAALSARAEAERALQQHCQTIQSRHGGAGAAASGDGTFVPVPVRTAADPARVALRGACDAVVRAESVLARLTALPVEQTVARQRLAAALSDLGHGQIWSVALARAACPVLEVDIDHAVRTDDDGRTRQSELALRLAQIEEALRGREAERAQLLSQGVVPTADDVRAARIARDTAWAGLRADFTSGPSVAAGPALQGFEQTMRQADALADALARDAGRAAQLQALQRQIADLARDRQWRQTERGQLQAEQAARSSGWQTRLQAAGLPALEPTSLREWQARLRVVRDAADQVERLELDAQRAQAAADQVRQGLWTALRAAGPAAGAAVAEHTPIATLLALARQCEDTFAREEQAALTAAAEQALRQEQRQREQREEQRLLAEAEATAAALRPVHDALRLPGTADGVAARARLLEWDQVRATVDQLAQARLAHARAQRVLADLVRKAAELAAVLQGPPPPGDLRHWIDDLGRRLDEARRLEGRRQVLAQALDEAAGRRQHHLAALQQLAQAREALCTAAGVRTEAELPAAEERARLRRDAEHLRDHVRDLLAQGGWRDEAALRALVGDVDLAQAQAEAVQCEQALADLAPRLDAARQRDEAARRARDAIDSGDLAAQARESMEQAGAAVRAGLVPWMRARLAQALLAQALGQFRERAQGPILRAASTCFAAMTGGEYDRLQSEPGDDEHRPVLQIRRRDGRTLAVDGLSEGTRDQLYLALRLAALQMHRERGTQLPLVLDDVLMTSDDDRAVRVLRMLADFAQGSQVLVFTHHQHLLDLARRSLPASVLRCSTL